MAASRNRRKEVGGADRDRTGDLMLAKHVLSQLSYSPTGASVVRKLKGEDAAAQRMVGLGRVELPTSPLSGVRSNQLSYRPVSELATTGSPAALYSNLDVISFVFKKSFEDKVEHAERLRRS